MIEKLNRVITLIEQTELLENQNSRVIELQERLSGRELIISVMGQFKTGKSSLINALLEEELLPVGIIPLTTVVTEIRSAKNFLGVVSFFDGSEKEIQRSDLLDYISEQENPDNEKMVSVVKLWTPHTPLGPDVTLVDTPGVGSVHLHNTETSNSYIEKSDGVLFLLSVDSPVSEMELDFLLKARKQAAKFYFAVNKIDKVNEENLQEFLSYCKVVLSKAVGFEVTLYSLSAKTGEGVDLLKKKLNDDLQSSYDELLEASVSIKLDAILAQTKAKLAIYMKAAKIPKDELEIKMSQVKEKQLFLNTLSDDFQVLVKSQTDRLVEDIKVHFEEILPDILSFIQTQGSKLEEEFKSLSSKQFELKFTAALEKVLREEINKLNDIGLDLLQEGYGIIVDSFNKKAIDTALYISEMVMEYFGVKYPVSTNTYPVSERSDYYVSLTFYEGISSWIHLLPRAKANELIYDKLMKKAERNLKENKTRIIYNYRYKMRESIRTLWTEFDRDISLMRNELNGLLTHVEKSHNVKDEELQQVEERFQLLIQQLDELN